MRLMAELHINFTPSYLINAARDGLKLSVPEAAQILVLGAQDKVAFDSGNLHDHIHAYQIEDLPNRQIWQVAPFDEAANQYGFDPAYARRIEYGFVGQDSLGRNYHQAAQPYMRPTADEDGPQAVGTIKEGVYDQMDSAMNRRAA